jgi:hypothetical protein
MSHNLFALSDSPYASSLSFLRTLIKRITVGIIPINKILKELMPYYRFDVLGISTFGDGPCQYFYLIAIKIFTLPNMECYFKGNISDEGNLSFQIINKFMSFPRRRESRK